MNKILTTLGLGLAVLVLAAAAGAAPVALNLDRSTIEIGAFYDGTTVLASGTVPAGSEAIVRVVGKTEELHMKKKGKVGGLLWMNTGDLTIENAPKIYMLYASAAGKDALANPQVGVSIESLQGRIKVLPESEDQKFISGEFIKLKRHNLVYAEFPGTVTYQDQPDGSRQFQVTLQAPPRMNADDYTIEVLAVKDGQVIGQQSAGLQVKMVGFPQMLARLAFQKGLLYGIFSVLVAVAAGFLTGILFRGKGVAH